jgi:hypothetical protein
MAKMKREKMDKHNMKMNTFNVHKHMFLKEKKQ